MKKLLVFGILLTLLLGAATGSVFAETPHFVVETVDKAREAVLVTIPAHAGEIADGVFSLGPAEVDGKIAEGFMFVHYKEGFAKPPWAGGGKGKGETKCYAFLAKGARWKTTEPYVLDTENGDELKAEFVVTTLSASFEAWDTEVTFDIFGSRDLSKEVDGADTENPDDKNEVFFGSIAEPGAIAVTIVWGFFSGPPIWRELIEYDLVFDDADYTWGYAGPTDEETLGTLVMDLENIATHELGHAAGMAHPDDSCTEETMYRFAELGETKKRTLNSGDIAGIQELYK